MLGAERKKAKVLLLITKADWAGAQRVVYELAKGYKLSDDLEVHVGVGQDGILARKLRALNVKVIIIKSLVHPIKPITDIKAFVDICKLIKQEKYDLVHCHSTKAGIIGRTASKFCKVPQVAYTIHGWWPILQFKSKTIRKIAILIEQVLAWCTTELVCISESDLLLSRELGIGNEKIYRVIYNQISIDEIPQRGLLRQTLEIPSGTQIVGNVARTDAQKSPFRFIEVAEQLREENIHWVWVGDGALLELCRRTVAQKNLQHKVSFIGFRENALDYMVDFNLLLLTSEWEGMPISILEAQSIGIPIVATDVGGIKEMIGQDCVSNIADLGKVVVRKLQNYEAEGGQKQSQNKMVEAYKTLISFNE